MRTLKDKGAQEINAFENRLRRSFGMNRISEEDYRRLLRKAHDLLNDLASIQEEDPKRREF